MSGPSVDPGVALNDTEALMWALDANQSYASTWANVSILEHAPDFERLRSRLERTSRVVRRLRQRVDPGARRSARPVWRFDPDFDLDRHVRRVSLPAPATDRQLFDLVARIVSTPFDRAHPLWEFTVVEGLEGGRAALVQKLHHAVTDGEGGVQLAFEYIDLDEDQPERDAAPMPPVPTADGPAPESPASVSGARALPHLARRVGRAVRRPGGLRGSIAVLRAGARHLATQVRHREQVLAPLWQQRGGPPRYDVLRIPFAEMRGAAKALGGSINDLFVSAAAEAAGAYHRAKGTPIHEVRVAMPISTREGGGPGGNAFEVTKVVVPARSMAPAEQLRLVGGAIAAVKERTLNEGGTVLVRFAHLVPPRLLSKVAQRRVRAVDFTASNVQGVPFALFIAGARVEANYPLGPLGGTAWNLTMLSTSGSMDMGLLVDTHAVDDPDLLRRLLEESFATLIAAA